MRKPIALLAVFAALAVAAPLHASPSDADYAALAGDVIVYEGALSDAGCGSQMRSVKNAYAQYTGDLGSSERVLRADLLNLANQVADAATGCASELVNGDAAPSAADAAKELSQIDSAKSAVVTDIERVVDQLDDAGE